MALFTSSSNLSNTTETYAALNNEVASSGVGYTTGGISVSLALSGTTQVKVDVVTDPVWTASGGSIIAKSAVIYKVGGNILNYCLLDSTSADITTADGNTLTVAANAAGIFTLS
jgi:hypothetical protein